MVARTQYRISGRFQQTLNHSELKPIFLYETAPGETWTGRATVRGITAATKSLFLNRMFVDFYVFYIPYRVVWDQWPNFVSQSKATDVDTIPTLPPLLCGTANDLNLEWLFCKQAMFEEAGQFCVNTLPLYCYNRVWNRYFREESQPNRAESEGTFALATRRPTDYHARLHLGARLDSPAIPTGTLDDLRGALARDQFANIRQRYGDKYVDYLRSLGVNTSSAIIDEPEVVAKVSKEMPYTVTANASTATGAVDLGATSGYFSIDGEINIGKTYTAEHGLLLGLAVARMDATVSGASHPAFAKKNWYEYWSPELDAEKALSDDKGKSTTFQANTASALAPNLAETPERFLDMKCGMILNSQKTHSTTGGAISEFTFTRATPAQTATASDAKEDLIRPKPAAFANAFGDQGKFGTVLTRTRFSKRSPIARYATDPLR